MQRERRLTTSSLRWVEVLAGGVECCCNEDFPLNEPLSNLIPDFKPSYGPDEGRKSHFPARLTKVGLSFASLLLFAALQSEANNLSNTARHSGTIWRILKEERNTDSHEMVLEIG
jgi:hypothetical protein